MKDVVLEKLFNFIVENHFIWNNLIKEIYVWSFQIWNLNFVNDLGWRNYQNERHKNHNNCRVDTYSGFVVEPHTTQQLFRRFGLKTRRCGSRDNRRRHVKLSQGGCITAKRIREGIVIIKFRVGSLFPSALNIYGNVGNIKKIIYTNQLSL
jgi:hypothetical protein